MKLLRRQYSARELWALRRTILGVVMSPRKMVNAGLTKLSTRLKLEKSLGLPLHALIEPTGQCNQRCLKCGMLTARYRDDGSLEGSGFNMPLELFKHIIDDIGSTLLTVRLWHYGEPFLNHSLPEMIRYAKRRRILTAVSSNLSHLGPGGADAIVNAGLDYLIVSCDGDTRESYKAIHGRDHFDRVMQNLEALTAAKQAKKSDLPFIELQFIVHRQNEAELETMRNRAQELGVDKFTCIRLFTGDVAYEYHESIDSDDDVLPENPEVRYETGRPPERADFCRVAWEETLIRYSGRILACATDLEQAEDMGRLVVDGEYQSFRPVWNAPAYRDFRRRVTADIDGVPMCNSCGKRDNHSADVIETSRPTRA